MIELTTAIWISIGLIVYYTIFQVFSDFVRSGMVHNTPNQIISELRTDYKVNLRTFQKNNSLLGFAWFNTIWLNENLFKRPKALIFTFHHEHYHLTHHHKRSVILMRLGFSLLPLLLSVIHWPFFTLIFFGAAIGMQKITEQFELKANNHAKKMITDARSETEGSN